MWEKCGKVYIFPTLMKIMVNFWDEQTETMPREDLEELQLKRMKGMIKRIYDKIPYFHGKYEELGLTPDDIQQLDDIQKFPVSVKDDFRANYPFGLFAEPRGNIVRLHAWSGTTGKSIVGGYTKHDVDEVFAEVCARSLATCGVTNEDIIQNAYGYGLFTGGLGIHFGAENWELP